MEYVVTKHLPHNDAERARICSQWLPQVMKQLLQEGLLRAALHLELHVLPT
jgi:hypothetical protein